MKTLLKIIFVEIIAFEAAYSMDSEQSPGVKNMVLNS